MKNTLLNKTIFHTQKYELNQDENNFGIISKLNIPLLPVEYTILGTACGLLTGLYCGLEGDQLD